MRHDLEDLFIILCDHVTPPDDLEQD